MSHMEVREQRAEIGSPFPSTSVGSRVNLGASQLWWQHSDPLSHLAGPHWCSLSHANAEKLKERQLTTSCGSLSLTLTSGFFKAAALRQLPQSRLTRLSFWHTACAVSVYIWHTAEIYQV